MNQPPQTDKQTGRRIVSKGEYVKARAFNLVLHSGLFTCAFGIVALLANIPYSCDKDADTGAVINCIVQPGWQRPAISHATVAFAACLFLVGPLIVAVNNLWRESHKSGRVLREMQILPRANTADLPAPDTLVRASAEPVQEPQAVLLRAATESMERHEEMLVRAVGSRNEPPNTNGQNHHGKEVHGDVGEADAA